MILDINLDTVHAAKALGNQLVNKTLPVFFGVVFFFFWPSLRVLPWLVESYLP
jgi:hypothetical protein